LKQLLEESEESEESYLVRLHQISSSGFYQLVESKFKFSEYQERLKNDSSNEAKFVAYVIRKGKATRLGYKDMFVFDAETGVTKVYRGKYEEKPSSVIIEPPVPPKPTPVPVPGPGPEPVKPEPLKPDESSFSWWYVVIVLLILVAIAVGVYIYCKRVSIKKHDLGDSNANENVNFDEEKRQVPL